MGNDEGRPTLHQLAESILNLYFGTGINRGCRFIEYQHRRTGQHDARYAQKLFLPLGQASAGLAYHGVVSLWQTLDEFVGMGGFSGGDDLLFACIGSTH